MSKAGLVYRCMTVYQPRLMREYVYAIRTRCIQPGWGLKKVILATRNWFGSWTLYYQLAKSVRRAVLRLRRGCAWVFY